MRRKRPPLLKKKPWRKIVTSQNNAPLLSSQDRGFQLRLKSVEGGFAIARWSERGELEQLSFPFATIDAATQFLAIARYDLGFIPSALPHVLMRFQKERA
jgi:hypothetical protein